MRTVIFGGKTPVFSDNFGTHTDDNRITTLFISVFLYTFDTVRILHVTDSCTQNVRFSAEKIRCALFTDRCKLTFITPAAV